MSRQERHMLSSQERLFSYVLLGPWHKGCIVREAGDSVRGSHRYLIELTGHKSWSEDVSLVDKSSANPDIMIRGNTLETLGKEPVHQRMFQQTEMGFIV